MTFALDLSNQPLIAIADTPAAAKTIEGVAVEVAPDAPTVGHKSEAIFAPRRRIAVVANGWPDA